MVLILGLFISVGIVACNSTLGLTINEYSSTESLATLSYLSGAFLSAEQTEAEPMAFNLSTSLDDIEIDSEMETVNEYFTMLKGFIENGPENFGQVQTETSLREGFQYQLTIQVDSYHYVLYYNINSLAEMTGLLVIDGVEYEITVVSNMSDFLDLGQGEQVTTEVTTTDEITTEEATTTEEVMTTDEVTTEEATIAPTTEVETEAPTTTEPAADTTTTEAPTTFDDSSGASSQSFNTDQPLIQLLSDDDDDFEDEEETEFDDEDETEIDDEDEFDDSEQMMVLIATNGEDVIKLTYKVEEEDSESQTKLTVEKTIAGVTSEVEIKIIVEDNEYKVKVDDGVAKYSLKAETEDDGSASYKIQYSIGEVDGQIKVIETTDEFGNTVYEYQLKEKGEDYHYKFNDFRDNDDDDDEIEDTEEKEI
ncbi:MAG: hypothetical protein PQJ44_06505 [Sphaerochaetaceae bacterium]|nr:hypothetical protein [Sphaerochaetaceae bacterium]